MSTQREVFGLTFLERRRAKAAQRAHDKALAKWQQEVNEWQQDVDDLEQFVFEAENHHGATAAEAGTSFMPKQGEAIFVVAQGTGLVEPRRLPGEYVGGYRGVSVRIAKGVSYRVGASRGTYARGPEQQTIVDEGETIITDRRVVFLGSTRNREWAYAKMLGYQHDPTGATYIQVSNRQNVSGVAYGEDVIPALPFKFDLALAHFSGELDDFREALAAQLEAATARRPTPPPALA